MHFSVFFSSRLRGCLALLSLLGISQIAMAQDSGALGSTQENRSAHFSANGSFVNLKNLTADRTISGVAGGVGFQFGFSDNFGIAGSFEQAFSLSGGLAPLYSMLEVGLDYSILGSLRAVNSTVSLGMRPVVQTFEYSPYVLKTELFVGQYFLNASNQVLGLSGAGMALAFDWHLTDTWGIGLFTRVSMISNSKITMMPLKFGANFFVAL